MKISALIAAAALVCGSSAFAAQSTDSARDARRSPAAMADKQAAPSGSGVVEKTKNVFRRMGDKMRNAGNRISEKTNSANSRSTVRDDEQGANTRAMGATGSSRADQDRRARMDEAYSNWQSKQK